ncbi:hypothetical protein L493_3361 [Bordetella bronchiseptica 99-R-0433]|nr:hypothetical protein L493_3361 [Bordetella bronchiseptica 99-R-0433]
MRRSAGAALPRRVRPNKTAPPGRGRSPWRAHAPCQRKPDYFSLVSL